MKALLQDVSQHLARLLISRIRRGIGLRFDIELIVRDPCGATDHLILLQAVCQHCQSFERAVAANEASTGRDIPEPTLIGLAGPD